MRNQLQERTLRFANRVRMILGRPTLAELPYGVPGRLTGCMLARALGGGFQVIGPWAYTPDREIALKMERAGFEISRTGTPGKERWEITFPAYCCDVIGRFDSRAWPEYIEPMERWPEEVERVRATRMELLG